MRILMMRITIMRIKIRIKMNRIKIRIKMIRIIIWNGSGALGGVGEWTTVLMRMRIMMRIKIRIIARFPA